MVRGLRHDRRYRRCRDHLRLVVVAIHQGQGVLWTPLTAGSIANSNGASLRVSTMSRCFAVARETLLPAFKRPREAARAPREPARARREPCARSARDNYVQLYDGGRSCIMAAAAVL